MDIAPLGTRSRMMAGIRSKDTKPEMLVRRGLFGRGLRYRLHDRRLPGRPDMVFPRYRVVAFVNGCFWHGHDCRLFKMPSTNKSFWAAKINGNRTRDARTRKALIDLDWRVLVIWECAVRGKSETVMQAVLNRAARWIRSGTPTDEIREAE